MMITTLTRPHRSHATQFGWGSLIGNIAGGLGCGPRTMRLSYMLGSRSMSTHLLIVQNRSHRGSLDSESRKQKPEHTVSCYVVFMCV